VPKNDLTHGYFVRNINISPATCLMDLHRLRSFWTSFKCREYIKFPKPSIHLLTSAWDSADVFLDSISIYICINSAFVVTGKWTATCWPFVFSPAHPSLYIRISPEIMEHANLGAGRTGKFIAGVKPINTLWLWWHTVWVGI